MGDLQPLNQAPLEVGSIPLLALSDEGAGADIVLANSFPKVDPYEDLTKADMEQNIKLRKLFSWATYCLVVIWLAVVVAIVSFTGFKAFGFSLPDNVLITLLVSSSANVIGLFFLVLKYLFDNKTEKVSLSR